MDLSNLKPAKGATKTRKRIGRGEGSGRGGTSTRGHKGAKSRSGYSRQRGFEGGQMPLYQRLPKRGFKNRFRKVWSIVNLDTLNRFESGTVVTPALLLESGIIKSLKDGIKILGKGNLEKELIVHAHSFSTQAKEKIEIAGGRTEVI